MIKTLRTLLATALVAGSVQSLASPPPVQEPSSPEAIKKALSGGVPMGRWKEGLLFEGISPQPWLTSAANWFPGRTGSTIL